MGGKKRPREPSPRRERGTTKRTKNSSQGTSGNAKFSKDSFLDGVRKLKLYTEGDKHYDEAKTKVGRLELRWEP